VLDLRYTCCDRILPTAMMDHMSQLRELIVTGTTWDMSQLQGGRLPNIRKLRVIKSQEQLEITSNASVYTDNVPVTNFTDQASEAPTITQIWRCPPAPKLPRKYVNIQDQPIRRTRLPLGASREVISTCSSRSITVPDMICGSATILHVHGSKSIICVPGPLQGSTWFFVCPKVVPSGEAPQSGHCLCLSRR
jgi:hypothetical protein